MIIDNNVIIDHIVGMLRKYCTEALRNSFLDDILDQDAKGVNSRDPNFTFNSSSLMTYCAGILTFTTVIAHAHMLDHAITIDQHTATYGPPIQRRARKNIHSMWKSMPKSSMIEGRGGLLWYEPPPLNRHVTSNLRMSQVDL